MVEGPEGGRRQRGGGDSIGNVRELTNDVPGKAYAIVNLGGHAVAFVIVLVVPWPLDIQTKWK